MFKVLVEKEIREIVGSTKFAVSFGACAVLIFLIFGSSIANYKSAREQYEAAVTENLRQYDGLADWSGVHLTRVFVKPEPIATLASGISNDISRISEVRGRGEAWLYGSRFADDPVLALFQFLDLQFFFEVILTLFAILLCYDAISGEKERGTLKLVFSNAVPRSKFLLAKLTAGFIVIGTTVVTLVSIGVLLMMLFAVPLSAGDWARLGLIVVVGLVYVACFMTASVFVSAVTRSSTASFLILLVVWIIFAQLLPRATVALAGESVPVLSADEVSYQKAVLKAQITAEEWQRQSEFTPSQDTSLQQATAEYNQMVNTMADDHDAQEKRLSDRLNEQRHNEQVIQARWGLTLARLSPSAAFHLATSSLAGTDLTMQQRFQTQVSQYQRVFADFLAGKTGGQPGRGLAGGYSNSSKGIDAREIPTFEYVPSTFSEALGLAAPDIGILLVYSLCAFGLAFLAFTRYDLR